MNLLKSKSRRSLATIFTFLLLAYDVKAGIDKESAETPSTLTSTEECSLAEGLAFLFTRLSREVNDSPESIYPIDLKEDEINQITQLQIRGLNNEEVLNAIRIVNLLTAKGTRDKKKIDTKAEDMIGKDYYQLLESFPQNSSFEKLILFLKHIYRKKLQQIDRCDNKPVEKRPAMKSSTAQKKRMTTGKVIPVFFL